MNRFSELVDQLIAYDASTNSLHYITRFIDGLFPDIRAVILIQRPTSLDTAYSLALLQEEAADPNRRKEFRRADYSATLRWSQKGAQAAPPPANTDKIPAGATDKSAGGQRILDRRLTNLKAWRRSQGLCDNCGEKWSRDHKCPAQVSLNALEQLYALFEPEASVDSPDAETEPSTEETCLCLASDASGCFPSVKTLQLAGIMNSRPIVLLVDSGSTTSFVSQELVTQLNLPTVQCAPFSVRVADGNTIQCSALVSDASWWIGDYQFQHPLKILPLQSYDVILGMDWLQLFSPMKINWRQQWLSIPYQGTTIRLHASPTHDSVASEELLVQVYSLTVTESVVDIPPAISQLLTEFQAVVTPPSAMPPKRNCDHAIPLIDGARPVNVRPYRYPPALKDEIEAQVDKMLQQGIIQPSTSPFNSPVLLVRKKDGTWRFYVDYRYLNALTVKTSFPIPIFEQLMDELAGAKWFSTLDLLSGYHQIRLQEGEEYKTAFSTHVGHYEFKVVAFGLTGAPSTFQGAMNNTLKPLLRRCAIVFFDDILIYSKTFEEHVQHLRQVLELL